MTWLILVATLATWGPDPARAADLSGKPFGVLLLGEGGDKDWKATADTVKKELAAKKLPFEFATGAADGKAIQRSVDRLQAQRVKKIVAVPLILSSFSDEMEQNRYLLGVREKPSSAFADAPHSHNKAAGAQARVKLKVPIVITKALDDSDPVVEVLASRARAHSHDPAKEIIVLVGQAPGAKEGLADWLNTANALAEKVRQKGGFRLGRAAALRDDADRKARDKSEEEAHRAIAALHRQGPVIVVPLELSPAAVHRRLPRLLEGIQARYDGKGLLPDERLARWVAESAESGAKLPDMSVFKDPPRGAALKGSAPRLKAGGGYQ